MSNFDFWKKANGCTLSAEIGINANGDVELAKELIMNASLAEWDVVKFQTRHVAFDGGCYKEEYLRSPRKSAWGNTQYDQKMGLEFTIAEWQELIKFCNDGAQIDWYSSVWDTHSVDLMNVLGIKAFKIPSAVLTNIPLLEYVVSKDKPVVLSTGMHTDEEIENAVSVFYDRVPLMLLYCVAAYPCDVNDIDLTEMVKLKYSYPICDVGYSGHEIELTPSILARNMGASMIERHITTDRTMEGSDQKAALEVLEMIELKKIIDEKQMPWPTTSFKCKEKTITTSEQTVREKFIQSMRGIK